MEVDVVAWSRADESRGHSIARVERTAEGWRCDATEVLAGPELLSCTFRVDLDHAWVTRHVEVSAVARDGAHAVRLDNEGGRWTRDGVAALDLDGCVDVDVAATPLTNTFPINRLADLPAGGSVTTPVAWVEVPGLRVLRVEQTYRRLGEREWEYSDPLHGAFRLAVDERGLVTDYEGFATRVAG